MKPCLKNPILTVRFARKKWAIFVLLVAILATMIVIFLLSAESVSESGERSFGVTVQIARILYPDFDDLSYAEQIKIVDGMHRIVRKGAHFTEYAVLGVLVMLALNEMFISYASSTRCRLCLAIMAAAFGLFYAILDEVHQKFVSRGASPRDVCIDFAGVIFGIGLVKGASYIIRRIRNGKHAGHRYGKGENA
jgi:VanZ family protein